MTLKKWVDKIEFWSPMVQNLGCNVVTIKKRVDMSMKFQSPLVQNFGQNITIKGKKGGQID